MPTARHSGGQPVVSLGTTSALAQMSAPPGRNQARKSLELAQIAQAFRSARTEPERVDAANRAIGFWIDDSALIQPGLRRPDGPGPILEEFRRATDHGIRRKPDYGLPRPELNRLVDLPGADIEGMLTRGHLHDGAFIGAATTPVRPHAHPLRNTLMHIEARYAADVSDLVAHPNAPWHMLPSDTTLDLVAGHLQADPDPRDPAHATQAELWFRQRAPDLPE
jgi:hypothetical protein